MLLPSFVLNGTFLFRVPQTSAGRSEGAAESEDPAGPGEPFNLVFDSDGAVDEGHHQS